MTEPRASMFVRTMAVTHVGVVVLGVYTLIRDPSWMFAALLAVIVLYAAYWIREAVAGR